MKRKIKNLTKIILLALLFATPASCCEIYILYENDDYTVLIDNVTNAGVCDMNLTFDASVVNITDVAGGDFDVTIPVLRHAHEGYVRIGAYQAGSPSGLDGAVAFAKIELWIDESESGVININVKEIKDRTNNTNPIPYTVRNFSVSIPPSVTVGSPDGGEHWKVGTSQNIEWTATDNVGVTSIDIEYSTDGGATYRTIATSIPNNGTYCWTVPDTLSGTCRVKVIARDAAGNTGWDVSDGDFTTAQPTTTGDSDDGDSSNGGGGGGIIHTPTPSPTPTASPVTPSATTTPAEEEIPAETATPTPAPTPTQAPTTPSLPSPIPSPIAAIVIVVIVAVFGIIRVIGITAQAEDETHAEAIASIKQAECKKAITAIIGIVVVAVAAIIAVALLMM